MGGRRPFLAGAALQLPPCVPCSDPEIPGVWVLARTLLLGGAAQSCFHPPPTPRPPQLLSLLFFLLSRPLMCPVFSPACSSPCFPHLLPGLPAPDNLHPPQPSSHPPPGPVLFALRVSARMVGGRREGDNGMGAHGSCAAAPVCPPLWAHSPWLCAASPQVATTWGFSESCVRLWQLVFHAHPVSFFSCPLPLSLVQSLFSPFSPLPFLGLIPVEKGLAGQNLGRCGWRGGAHQPLGMFGSSIVVDSSRGAQAQGSGFR